MAGQVKTLGIISLIIGILALFIFCIPVLALIMAITGLILGINGIVASKKTDEPGGIAIAGTVLNAMALLIGIVWNVIVFTGGDNFFDNNDEWFDKNHDDYQDEYYEDDVDTNYIDIDSLMLEDDEIDELDETMNDEDNGPGPAPG